MLDVPDFDIDKDILKKKIADHIDRLRRNRDRDKTKTKYVVIIGGITSAITTSLLGLSKFYPLIETPLQTLALVCSAILTIVLTWDKLFNHKKLWLLSARTLRDFYDLREDMEHMETTNTLTPEMLRMAYARYKDILLRSNQSWDSLRNDV